MPPENLKIGFVFDDSLDSYDGVAQYIKTLGRWLTDQGHNVGYLVGETKMTSWSGGKVYSLAKNIKVDFNRNRLSIPMPASSRKIKEILADENYDVLHVQLPYSPFLAQKVIRSAPQSTAVVGTFHILPAGRLARVGSKSLKAAYGRSLNRFDAVVSVSQPAADFARHSFGLKSERLPNVIDLKKFSRASAQPEFGKIVFLGRLVPRKGGMELLKAFRILHSSHPDFKLIIAGDGPEKKSLQRYADKNNLLRVVDFKGMISEQEKPVLLGSAAIACFPSTGGESFGIVLLEAMASGSGVVLGGDNDGYRSVLGGQPELLIDPSDSVKFAQRLKRLMVDKKLAKELNSWQRAEVNNYDVNIVGAKLVALYRKTIAKKK